MMELEEKFVFHIPTCKYVNSEMIAIDIDKSVDDLIIKMNEKGFDSLYITKAKGYYKNRCFNEVLITIFASESDDRILPDLIFKEWFKENNNILEQEAFAYEHNNRLIVENLIK